MIIKLRTQTLAEAHYVFTGKSFTGSKVWRKPGLGKACESELTSPKLDFLVTLVFYLVLKSAL